MILNYFNLTKKYIVYLLIIQLNIISLQIFDSFNSGQSQILAN